MTLDYSLTFGGVPFVVDTAQAFVLPAQKPPNYHDPSFTPPKDQQPQMDLLDELDRLQEFDLTNEFVAPSDYPGRNVDSLATKEPATPKDTTHIRLYDYWYPNGATRWSVFRGLATSSMAKAMLQATKGNVPQTFVMKCNPIAPNHADSNVASYTISTSLYMLSCRPLREHGGFDGLYLITLVDERYYFRKTASTTLHFHQLKTWDSLISQLATSLGITLTYSSIPTAYAYPEPDSQLWTNYEDVTVLLDAIAYNIGRVVVRNLDGTYKLQSYLEAQSAVISNRTAVAGSISKVTRLAGGDIFQSGTQLPVGDLFNNRNPVVPASINFSFPKYVQGNDPVPHYLNPRYSPQRPTAWWEDSYGEVHRFTVAAASGGAIASGVSGIATLSLHTTAKALYDTEAQAISGGSPTNASGLNALAYQMANDFYGWKLAAALDEVYPGTYLWNPEGIHDIIWTYSARRRVGCTRVVRAPWNQTVHEFQHSSYPLSGYTNIPIGVGGKSVAQTWRDSTVNGGSTTLYGSGNLNLGGGVIGSGDLTMELFQTDSFPNDNRWRGTIGLGSTDQETCLFEGVSGGAGPNGGTLVTVVYRGIDNSIQQLHKSGVTIVQVLPDTIYGVNSVLLGQGLVCHQNAWTSGGISEVAVDLDSDVTNAATPAFGGGMWVGGLGLFYGGIDVQGGIISSPVPPPDTIKITTTNPTPATQTTYTYGITTVTTTGQESQLSQAITVTNNTPLDNTNTNAIKFNLVTGIPNYNLYQNTPKQGLVATVSVNLPNMIATVTTPAGTTTQPVTTTRTQTSITLKTTPANPSITVAITTTDPSGRRVTTTEAINGPNARTTTLNNIVTVTAQDSNNNNVIATINKNTLTAGITRQGQRQTFNSSKNIITTGTNTTTLLTPITDQQQVTVTLTTTTPFAQSSPPPQREFIPAPLAGPNTPNLPNPLGPSTGGGGTWPVGPPGANNTGLSFLNGIITPILQVPQLPSPTTAPSGVFFTTPNGNTISYVYVIVDSNGNPTLPSPTLTITDVAVPSTTNPIGLTVPVTTTGVPAAQQPTLYYLFYRVAPNDTGLPNGPFAIVPQPATGNVVGVIDEGQDLLFGISADLPTTNGTGTANVPQFQGTAINRLPIPGAPTVVSEGTIGGSTYAYEITAEDYTGSTPGSSPGTTIDGAAALSDSDYNQITWTPVHCTPSSYGVYRVSGGSSQGKIGTVYPWSPLVFNDTGIAASGGQPPTTNTTGRLLLNGVEVYGSGSITSGMLSSDFINNITGTSDHKFLINTGDSTADYASGKIIGVSGLSTTVNGASGNYQSLFMGIASGGITSGMLASGLVANIAVGVGTSTVTYYSGSATGISGIVFTFINSGGCVGACSIKNTDATFSLLAEFTGTNFFGTSGTAGPVNVTTGSEYSFNFLNMMSGAGANATAPFSRISLSVVAVTSGHNPTYQANRSTVG